VVESSALLKRRTPKGYRGFESLPHRSLSRETELRRLFSSWRILIRTSVLGSPQRRSAFRKDRSRVRAEVIWRRHALVPCRGSNASPSLNGLRAGRLHRSSGTGPAAECSLLPAWVWRSAPLSASTFPSSFSSSPSRARSALAPADEAHFRFGAASTLLQNSYSTWSSSLPIPTPGRQWLGRQSSDNAWTKVPPPVRESGSRPRGKHNRRVPILSLARRV
jgi:hypothetical protein